MANQSEVLIVLCPDCGWQTKGTDVEALRREKNQHLTYECPLPPKSTTQAFRSSVHQAFRLSARPESKL